MKVVTYFDGSWHNGSPPIMGPMTQSFMHGTTVFDGARAFDGLVPDLDRHCQRLLHSAEVMVLSTPITAAEVEALARDGVRRFPAGTPLYIRPALYAEDGFLLPEGVARFVLAIFECPMPAPTGLSVMVSAYRRPTPDMAPTAAKASSLYATSGHAIRAAAARGYDNAIMRDGADNVVEFASSNLWIARDGEALTPAPNGTFLDGITKHRVMDLLRADGVPVREVTMSVDDVLRADEVFSTGNLGKVMPVTRVEDRDLQPGPLYTRARELYWKYAATQRL